MRFTWRKWVFLSVSFAALVVFSTFFAIDCSCASNNTGHALALSDIHFNPFYDSSLFQELVNAESDAWAEIFASSSISAVSGYGNETNFPLLDAALDSAAMQVPDPAFILFPGDILAHGFNQAFFALYGSEDQAALQSFILKTVTFFANQLHARFPEAPVFFTLGNNDAYLGDYDLAPGGDYLNQTAQPLYAAFLQNRATCADYDSTYKTGGYFSADFSDMVVLSLNSVLFSHRRPAPVAGNAAWTQLDWFAAQLASARTKGARVIVVTHVPPGIDIFVTAHSHLDEDGKLTDAQLMWHKEYKDRFLTIVEEYADVISMVYTGHTHMDEFRFMDGAGGVTVPLVVTPAISPLFQNNPGYKVLETSSDGAIIENYQAITLPLQETPGAFAVSYDFQKQYVISAPDGTGLPLLYSRLRKSAPSKRTYVSHYYGDVSGSSAITDVNWPVYYCGIANMRKDSMLDCVNEYAPSASTPFMPLLLQENRE